MHVGARYISPALLTATALLVLNGCAVNHIDKVSPQIKAQSTEKPPAKPVTGHHVLECESVQRDLSRPWNLRQYWCAKDSQKKQFQIINDTIMNLVIENPSYSNNLQPIVDVTPTANIAIDNVDQTVANNIQVSVANNLSVENGISTSNNVTPSTHIDPGRGKQSNDRNIYKIFFAHNIKVLGPKGRMFSESLLPKAMQSRKVLLRGLILPDEVMVDSDLYKEKISVSRALAVREFWKEKGMDVSNVTILHYKPNSPGRAVKVIFNG